MRRNNPTAGQFHNPGYEYLKQIYLLKDEQVYDSSQNTSPHFRPLLALQIACQAIEGYVDHVGRQVDPAWDEHGHGQISIGEHIARIYKQTGKPVDFKQGIWHGVLTLFEMADLIHINPLEFKHARESDIPESLRDIAAKYPIQLSLGIAEEAVETLLDQHSKLIKSSAGE